MVYISIGAFGFLLLHLLDFVSLKRIPGAKPLAWISGSGLLVYSLVMASFAPNKLPLPIWATWLGWALLTISLSLLIYSLFINLPFRKTYFKTGVGDKLVTTGLFALVRCPWVPCSALIFMSLILISKSSLLLIASPILILLNILLAVIQDRFFFDRMFPGYDRYRKETPMLLPNRKSISAYIRTIRNRA
jgi:protein-S-isoprenylcysteine O-methyltransferase Ste14